MKLIELPMGCLSSRSSVKPSDRVVDTDGQVRGRARANGNLGSRTRQPDREIKVDRSGSKEDRNVIDEGVGKESSYMNYEANETRKKKSMSRDNSLNSSVETADDDIMSLLMEDKNKPSAHKSKHRRKSGDLAQQPQPPAGESSGRKQHLDTNNNSLNGDEDEDDGSAGVDDEDDEGNTSLPSKRNNEGSFDEEPNMELLRQYVAVDYEIGQLEDKDALRVYHEKIEQLEQLEHELDMISTEVEEAAGRSGDRADVSRAASGTADGQTNLDSKTDLESNSMISGVSGNTSQRFWLEGTTNKSTNNKAIAKTTANINKSLQGVGSATGSQNRGNRSYASSRQGGAEAGGNTSANQISYSTVEEVFNRKIILEKERDKLKKEVEIVILECDKLQQRYKKRDEILDNLFDGRTGNGLENHLEQQLNWLLEQKHYVDQVFFAWKRAETLTSQTCEQFASALELLKKLPKIESPGERAELAKSIERLLLKSRQDMEQAQKYNPNVDAPFFTDNETERFDKIIKTIQSEQINPSDYSQILTVIQFAYKRAVSIRLWLEQILQTTIARDSFELAEEYKWIAIQLRKERINLIKSKLQDSPYRSMARSVQDQLATQSLSERKHHHHQQQQQQHEAGQLKVVGHPLPSGSASESNRRDQMLQERVQRRVRAGHQLHLDQVEQPPQLAMSPFYRNSAGGAEEDESAGGLGASGRSDSAGIGDVNQETRQIRGTPTKLKVQLDEEARQSLLKQVDQVHVRHKDRMERLRGNNRAKATEFITNKMQKARQSASAQSELQQ